VEGCHTAGGSGGGASTGVSSCTSSPGSSTLSIGSCTSDSTGSGVGSWGVLVPRGMHADVDSTAARRTAIPIRRACFEAIERSPSHGVLLPKLTPYRLHGAHGWRSSASL